MAASLPAPLSVLKMLCVVAQMLFYKGRDKEITVIVTRLVTQGQRMIMGAAGLLKQLRLELLFKKVVAVTLVDQQRLARGSAGDKGAGIILRPQILVISKIASKRLLPPGAVTGIDDGRKGGHRGVALWVAQGQYQRTMSAHGVAADSLPTINWKVCLNECGQFLSNVVVHLVVLIPGSLCGVDVKTGPGAEVIAVIL